MRKPKESVDDESGEADFFEVEVDTNDVFESVGPVQHGRNGDRDAQKRNRPARQRVELRNEQQVLRRQLSDWDDYDQDGFDTKL